MLTDRQTHRRTDRWMDEERKGTREGERERERERETKHTKVNHTFLLRQVRYYGEIVCWNDLQLHIEV